ncbi:MAG: hypothetical protein KDK70_29805 [Myxococcales bacterium]|nr:hypothetical protein [Myxococcales bacterium]
MGARWGAVLVAMGLMMGPVAVSAADDDDDEETEVEAEREIASIKIEIKLESGRVVKPEDAFTIDFGVENSLEIQAEGSSHKFLLKVDRKGDKDKDKVVALTVGYDRDGEAIVAPYTFDAKLKKREVLRIEGGMALAFTITPKKVTSEAPPSEDAPEEPSEKPREKGKIDVCGKDDPLCGVD